MSQTLLTIEDEAGIRESIGLYFEDHDYRVLTAENGGDGLTVFQRERPDVVLVDLRMPGINGLEVIATIKDESPDTPVIVVSGTGILADAISAVRLGAWDYVTKPIDDMNVLGHIVDKALERAQLIRENRAYHQHLEGEIKKRTADLEASNDKLLQEINEHIQAEKRITEYQDQLRALVSQLTISEELERKRLASKLHDGIGQSLIMMKMKADSRLSDQIDKELRDYLMETQQSLIDIINDAQSITSNLGSPILQKLGFKAAIDEWLKSEIENKHHIRTTVEDTGFPNALNSETMTLLFRAVRELAINVVKHAKAKSLDVLLQTREDQLHICVADDGVGFKQSAEADSKGSKGGYGLFSIKERINYMGGRVDIESLPGEGTKVTLIVPMKSTTGQIM
jgi:signal transduction histidine kinase